METRKVYCITIGSTIKCNVHRVQGGMIIEEWHCAQDCPKKSSCSEAVMQYKVEGAIRRKLPPLGKSHLNNVPPPMDLFYIVEKEGRDNDPDF